MEKNERLAWRTKPRAYGRCFSSCTKSNCNGRPFQLQISKNNFSEPEKLFIGFPLQTPLRAGSELVRCFSSCPERSCNGRPFQLANLQKKSGPEKLFFDFPLQTPLRAGSELWPHTPVTCLNPLGPTKTERTPNLNGTRRGNKFRI